MNKISLYLQQLSPRERLFVLSAGSFLLLIAIYLLLIRPAYNYYSSGRTQLMEMQELSLWIESNSEYFDSLSKGSSSAQTQDKDLLQVFNAAAQSHKLEITRLEPTVENRIRGTFANAAFPSVVSLIHELETQGIIVESLSVEATAKTGYVNASIVVGIN